MQTWIPRTKLNPPDISHAVEREHLVETLQQAIQTHKLTLVSAPAGSGKTTLLSMLVHAQSAVPTAWLSIDDSDNDPSTFISALIGAFRTVNSNCGAAAESLFEGSMSLDPKRHVAILINDALQVPPFLLVLDDLHVIREQSVLQAVDFLLERLPPSIHVLISTREDPALSLARLRAQGQLYELRLETLRFDPQETATLLNHQLKLNLSDADLARITERTDGWVAGLRLIGLSLSQAARDLRSQRITQMIENNRYIFDLLAEEVLRQQEPSIQDFLLSTALLDELSPQLCEAVSGCIDSGRILVTLYRRNLFLRLLDGATQTYRYHDLFADFLRHQLQLEHPEWIADLHRRAAAADPVPQRRIQHYLAASAWDEAAELIIELGGRMVETGNRVTVQNWIDQLPVSVRDCSGWIVYLQGALTYYRGDLDRAREILTRARQKFEEEGDEDGIAEAIVMHYASSPDNEHLDGLERFIQSLEAYPLMPAHHLYVELAKGWVYLYEGYPERATLHYLETLRFTYDHPEFAGLLGFQIAAPIVFAFADVRPLLVQMDALLNKLTKPNVLTPAIYGILAQVALWQGDPQRAQTWAEKSSEQWEQFGGLPNLHSSILVWQQTIIAWMLHDQEKSAQLAEEIYERMTNLFHLAMFRARQAWCHGDYDEAQKIVAQMPNHFDESSLNASVYYACIRALLDLDTGGIEATEALLKPYIAQQRRRRFYSRFVTDVRVTLAFCYWRQEMERQALETLASFMSECEQSNAPGRVAQEGDIVIPLMELAIQRGVHADFARRVLDLLTLKDLPRPIIIELTGETLTPREVEVLRLLVNGATNRDIAEQFVISIPTVKSHVSHILQKLDVTTRTQAAAKVRELSLL